MKGWLRLLAAGRLLRQLLHQATRIADGLEAQTTLLRRLADQLAPLPLPDVPATVADGTVSGYDATAGLLAEAYVAKVEREQHRTPTDEEIVIYLEDEATVSLRARFEERQAALDALTGRG